MFSKSNTVKLYNTLLIPHFPFKITKIFYIHFKCLSSDFFVLIYPTPRLQLVTNSFFFYNSDFYSRDMYRMSGHSKSFGQTKSSDTEPKVYIKPRIITVLRSGTRPRKAVRVLLNNR